MGFSTSMDLELLKRYASGELTAKQFLAFHKEAGELLDLLYEYLRPLEVVVSVQDWPEPRKRTPLRQFLLLKTMMLVTPVVMVGALTSVYRNPILGFTVVLGWLLVFSLLAFWQLYRRWQIKRSKSGMSVLIVTNQRLMRVWLDGSEEVQAWPLADEPELPPMEPVSSTIKLLLELDLGKISMN